MQFVEYEAESSSAECLFQHLFSPTDAFRERRYSGCNAFCS